MIRYIRAYVEVSQWCFERRNRKSCLDILTRHNEIDGPAAEHTLDALLNPDFTQKPASICPELQPLSSYEPSWVIWRVPIPAVKKCLDLSYYRKALSISE